MYDIWNIKSVKCKYKGNIRRKKFLSNDLKMSNTSFFIAVFDSRGVFLVLIKDKTTILVMPKCVSYIAIV